MYRGDYINKDKFVKKWSFCAFSGEFFHFLSLKFFYIKISEEIGLL